MTYDTIIRNGRWFDGTGAPSAIRNLGIRDGHVFAVTRAVFLDGEPTDIVGTERTGRFLRAAHKASALTIESPELASVS